MEQFKKFIQSTVGRKFIMGLTGIALVLFVIGHLAGNLQLLLPGGQMFNEYAHKLVSLGPLLYLIEAGLIAIVLLHIYYGIYCNHESKAARSGDYQVEQTKGGESHNNFSSRNMLILGLVLFVFIILHILHFKIGAFSKENYTTEIHGTPMRDLYRLVAQEFQKGYIVLLYVGAMLALGFHLRHGIWSAFQSIGAMPKTLSVPLYIVGTALAVALTVGFILLPIYIYADPFGAVKAYLNQLGSG